MGLPPVLFYFHKCITKGNMKAYISKTGKLIIEIDLPKKPQATTSGRAFKLAQTDGFESTGVLVPAGDCKGQEIGITLCATCRPKQQSFKGK